MKGLSLPPLPLQVRAQPMGDDISTSAQSPNDQRLGLTVKDTTIHKSLHSVPFSERLIFRVQSNRVSGTVPERSGGHS